MHAYVSEWARLQLEPFGLEFLVLFIPLLICAFTTAVLWRKRRKEFVLSQHTRACVSVIVC